MRSREEIDKFPAIKFTYRKYHTTYTVSSSLIFQPKPRSFAVHPNINTQNSIPSSLRPLSIKFSPSFPQPALIHQAHPYGPRIPLIIRQRQFAPDIPPCRRRLFGGRELLFLVLGFERLEEHTGVEEAVCGTQRNQQMTLRTR